MLEQPFKFRHVNELTGLFVLGVLAVVVVGVIFSGHSQRWFSHKYSFDVRLPETGAFGLRRGDEVFIKGVSVGWVHDVLVGEDGRMTARVKIRGDFERFVRTDSTATLKKVFGVAGDSFMEISHGTNAPLPGNGATINCLSSEELPDRLERMAKDLRTELMPIVKQAGVGLDEWVRLGHDLRHNSDQIREFMARLDHLAAGVENGEGSAGQFLTETALSDEAQKVVVQAGETLGELRGVITNLNAASKSVQTGAVRLPEITEAIATEARDLPGLVRQTQVSMREMERLIEAMQHHWLVRKYVNQTNPPAGPLLPASRELPRNPFRSPKDAVK